MSRMGMGFRASASAVAAAAAAAARGGAGGRNMSTVSKVVAEIGGMGKSRKSSSELCKFLGIPHQSRSEIALIISKFIKLYNFKVPNPHPYPFFSYYYCVSTFVSLWSTSTPTV